MAAFGIVVRAKRNDGFYPVYIRVSHGSGMVSYIKTSFVVSERGLRKTYTKSGKEKIEVSDVKVVRECMNEIAGYARRLNDVDSDKMTIQEVILFLKTGETELSFSTFAEEYITSMKNKGRDNSSGNYRMAVKRLHEFIGKDNILFKDLTFAALTQWIDSMLDSQRKRNLYPTCIKTMYAAALSKYNDEDRDIIKIRKNPFARIKIPANRTAKKRSTEIDNIRIFFNRQVRETFNKNLTKEKIAQDVCMLIFCLAGINTADLYDLPTDSLSEGTIHYRRKKTRDKSAAGAYTEIKVPKSILPLLAKYKGTKRLFVFSDRYTSADIFADVIAKGCKRVCDTAGLKDITPYSFRHSWATIAINNCGASMDDVAFALNHASEHRVTNIYIRPDFSRIDLLNKKVIGKVFNREIPLKTLKAIIDKRKKKDRETT